MRESLLDALSRVPFLVLDGAIGTELMRKGLEPGACPEAWNRDRPDAVRAVHASYADVGCRVLTTNSFGGHPARLLLHELDDDAEELDRAAAELAREAAGDDRWVLGSLGPCGEILEPIGTGDPGRIAAGFAVQARALVAGGADLLLAETMGAVEEMELAVRAAREAGAAVVGASFAFDRTNAGEARTMMGVDAATAARAAVAAGVDLVGCNCGTGFAPEELAPVVAALAEHSGLPVLAEPNAGAPDPETGAHAMAPDEFARGVRALLDAGARLIGGCCGTTPAHLAAVGSLIG